MYIKGTTPRFSILILLFISSFILACSYPSWFPIKKGAPYKAKMKGLLDKEVVIIDREEYVKVVNPKASESPSEPKYLYLPVNEYLLKKDSFDTPVFPRKEETGKATAISQKPVLPPAEKEVFVVSTPGASASSLKKKVVITRFDDRTIQAEEIFGDLIAERLVKEIDRRTQRVLLVDYEMLREFLQGREIALTDLEKPTTLRFINEVFGIHAVIFGHLSGPYVFTSKNPKDQQENSSAILRIEVSLVDAFTGYTLKTLSVNNPILAARGKGAFSDEKAKMRAIDLAVADLGRSLSGELEKLDWFCRIAKVEGEEIYLNAGKLTGLKIGDILEVYRPGKSGGREATQGKVRISAFFGLDASTGRLLEGKPPEMNDILKLARREGK